LKCEATDAVQPHANVGHTLLTHAEGYGADLPVVGCHDHSRLRKFVLGGASEHVPHIVRRLQAIENLGSTVDQAVDVARESSDMVLLGQDLDVLKSDMLDGRRTLADTLKGHRHHHERQAAAEWIIGEREPPSARAHAGQVLHRACASVAEANCNELQESIAAAIPRLRAARSLAAREIIKVGENCSDIGV
jgi:hypothetical protein